MSKQKYFASSEKGEEELKRVRLLKELYDPVTIRHLEVIQVSSGWSCLEVGAGAGSIVKWLSTRIGPSEKVVATDINLRFLNQLNIPNLEIRQNDIIKDDLVDHLLPPQARQVSQAGFADRWVAGVAPIV
jgi:16S rRNA A1518/A1519 N6-dimethyltransferase RsmA/KsgA/DIM1 with predicted DNA glycosylase/AP lyase activity